MKKKLYFGAVLTAFFCSMICVSAAEEQPLPPLIQTTTPEGDYKAITGLNLAQTAVLSKEDTRKAYENILCSCVRIQAGEHYGSGSIFRMLEDEMILVTNSHVLQYWDEESYVTFFGGRAESAAVLGMSEKADVGFLSVPTESFSWEELLRFRNVRLWEPAASRSSAKETGRSGAGDSEGTAYFGVDMATDPYHPVMEEGEIISFSMYLEDFEREMIYGTGSAVPGMSGSGVFDGYGYYLGMLTGGTPQGEVAAVPAEVIASTFLKLSGKPST